MTEIIKNNRTFLVPYLFMMVPAIFLLVLYPKADIHLFMNKLNSPFFDAFFKHITFLGDGIFIVAISMLLLYRKISYAVCSLSIYLGSGIVVQLFKRIILPDAPRPKKFFEGMYDLHLVEGVNLHGAHSFPSGHTASAFGMFLLLAIISKNKLAKSICFMLAFAVGYSRIYISQHFLLDVVVGSLIGAISAIVIFYYIQQIKNNRFHQPLFIRRK